MSAPAVRKWIWRLGLPGLLCGVVALAVAWLNLRGEAAVDDAVPSGVPAPELVQRGAYLARAGNCAACHTARGGAPFAGGRGIETPFGTVYASNITPDPDTGTGKWSADHFWRALHHGRSRDGRLLYPAFPYPEYTRITREDSDAIYAFLRSLPAVKQPNRPHSLRFPYGTQVALAIWRALFFSPATFVPETDKSAQWNRGAYLVRGLGHCQACHAPRNRLGASDTRVELSGGFLPMGGWYAPSLASPAEAGVQDWSVEEIVRLLRDGLAGQGATLGPMAEVVFASTQHLDEADLRAMAVFLRELPQHRAARVEAARAPAGVLRAGESLYREHCAECHGEKGEGSGAAYLPLAGRRTVTMSSGANLVKTIVDGGFPPTTAGNPRPYGMPPFGQILDDAQIAALASFLRQSWGNDAPRVSEVEVQRAR